MRSTKLKSHLVLGAGVALSTVLLNTTAFAGFNWQPSVAPEKAIPVEVLSVDKDVLTPVPNSINESAADDTSLNEQTSAKPSVEQDIEEVAALSTVEPEPVVETMPALAAAPRAETARMSVIEGFGRDVPLSYAIATIVPSKFGYAFGADVNPALPVTWQGGKPWDEVLSDAVAPEGLFVHVGQQKVSIQSVPPVKENKATDAKVSNAPANVPVNQPMAEAAVTSNTQQASQSEMREVFVRRETGQVEAPSQGGDAAKDVTAAKTSNKEDVIWNTHSSENAPIDLMAGDSMDEISSEEVLPEAAVSEEGSLESTEATSQATPVEEMPVEEVYVPRINPDMPAEIEAYVSPASDENVFEVVMSQTEAAYVLDTKRITTFRAKAGQTVRDTLERWSDEANVQIFWETPYDFPVEKSITLTATYPMAVQALLGRLETVEPRPTAKLHPNWPHGPSILTVK